MLQNIQKKVEEIVELPKRKQPEEELHMESRPTNPQPQVIYVDRPVLVDRPTSLQVAVTLNETQPLALQLPSYVAVPFLAPFEFASISRVQQHRLVQRRQASPMAMMWNRALPYPAPAPLIHRRMRPLIADSHRLRPPAAPLAIDWSEGLHERMAQETPPRQAVLSREAINAPARGSQQPLLLTWHPGAQAQKPDSHGLQVTTSAHQSLQTDSRPDGTSQAAHPVDQQAQAQRCKYPFAAR